MLGLVLPGILTYVLSGSCRALLVSADRLCTTAAAARAAVRAFWITKLGDVASSWHGAPWSATGTFEFTELFEKAEQNARRAGPRLTMFLIFSARWVISPVPPSRVVPTHGGADAGVGAHPRRDDGDGGVYW